MSCVNLRNILQNEQRQPPQRSNGAHYTRDKQKLCHKYKMKLMKLKLSTGKVDEFDLGKRHFLTEYWREIAILRRHSSRNL